MKNSGYEEGRQRREKPKQSGEKIKRKSKIKDGLPSRRTEREREVEKDKRKKEKNERKEER